MKTGTKLAIAGGVGLLLYATKKTYDYSEVLTKMTMNIDKIRNLRNRGEKFYFDCDVMLKNNTNIDLLPATAGMISIKRISVIANNQLIGNAYGTISEFKLPKRGQQEIKNIQVELLSLNLIDQLFAGQLSTETAFTIEIEIQAFGKTFILEQ